jgi:protein required for attachment to host cells
MTFEDQTVNVRITAPGSRHGTMGEINRSVQNVNIAACLIAAAPEMLSCLKKVVKWGKDYPSHRIYCESAIKKIAKEIDAICEDAERIISKVDGK